MIPPRVRFTQKQKADQQELRNRWAILTILRNEKPTSRLYESYENNVDTKLRSTIERLIPIFSDASQLPVGGRFLVQPVCCRAQYGWAAHWDAYSKASLTLYKNMPSLRPQKNTKGKNNRWKLPWAQSNNRAWYDLETINKQKAKRALKRIRQAGSDDRTAARSNE